MGRKLWLWLFVLAITIVYVSLGVWGFYLEPSSLTTHRTNIKLPHWPVELAGIRIAVLTDLHVGSPYVGMEKLKLVVARTNEERPDLVLILGDYLTHNTPGARFIYPEPIAKALKDLRAPLGVVSVLGNHDWWFNGARVTKALRAAGIVVLENEAYRIQFNGKPFWIAGVADLMTRKPDIMGTVRQVNNDDPIILITHNPDIFPQVPSRVSLTIAGHTHGGQVNFPLFGRLIVPSYFGQKYAIGHVVEQGRHLFVSSGIGTSMLPVRFRVPPEIVVLTLQPE
ncbi:MAG TPA: metallophosphoesterase [Terriglobia bacterium]|nr:metallophosphoesterase [Terriglobia bacterium]